MERKTTDELRHEIKEVTDFGDYVKRNKKDLRMVSLSAYLNEKLLLKGLTKADVIRGSQLGRAYVYQIFADDKNPSRDKLIALAFGMHLSEEETQQMLKLSGNRELYARDERDALILFSIQRNKNIFETNESLFDHGFPVLDTIKE